MFKALSKLRLKFKLRRKIGQMRRAARYAIHDETIDESSKAIIVLAYLKRAHEFKIELENLTDQSHVVLPRGDQSHLAKK